MVSTAWVAPSSCAFSRLKATGSTAMTWPRPGVRRALHGVDADAADAHDDDACRPGWTSAALTAEPQPVPTPQPTQAGDLERDVLSIFTAERIVDRRGLDEGRDAAHLADRRSPSAILSRKLVGSSHREPASSPAPRSQRFCWPEAHQRQWPQEGRNEKTTWSPSSKPLSFGADLGDDAGALVAARERVDADRDVAGGDVVVGVAQPGGHQLDLDLARPRVVDLEVHDLPRAGSRAHDRAAGVDGQGTSSSPSSSRADRACAGTHDCPARYGPGHTAERGVQRRRAARGARCTVLHVRDTGRCARGPGGRGRRRAGRADRGPAAGAAGLEVLVLDKHTARPIRCPARCTWTTRCFRVLQAAGVADAFRRAAGRSPGCACWTAGTGCWRSSAATRRRASTAGRRGRWCTSPTSRRCWPRPWRGPGDRPSGAGRGHRTDPGRRRRHARRRRRRGGPVRPGGRGARLRRRRQHRARADRRAMRDLGPADRWLVARRPLAGTAADLAGCAPGVRLAPAGDVHAGDRRPVPLGVPAGAGETVADATAPDRLARSRAGRPARRRDLRAAEYTFRAQVADRWRAGRVLLAGDAAHLTRRSSGRGWGSGCATCTSSPGSWPPSWPARRTTSCWTPTRRSASRTPAR